MFTKKLIPFLLFCLSLTASSATDTLKLNHSKIGLSFLYETVFEKQANRRLSDRIGYGLEFSVDYEKRILEKVFFSTGLNFRYKDFNDQISQRVNVRNSDTTAFVHVFQVEQQLSKLSIPINFRCLYFNNPKWYIVLGLSPEYTFRRQENATYQKTVIEGKPAIQQKEDIQQGVPLQAIDRHNFTLKTDLGIGFSLKKTALELVLRYDAFNEYTTSIGFRVRQQFIEFKPKKKEAVQSEF